MDSEDFDVPIRRSSDMLVGKMLAEIATLKDTCGRLEQKQDALAASINDLIGTRNKIVGAVGVLGVLAGAIGGKIVKLVEDLFK